MKYEPTSFNRGDAFRQRYISSIAQAKSISEIKRIFSNTACRVIGEMLERPSPIDQEAIQLLAENGGAIFIQESLADSAAFQQICQNSSCISILKNLAEIALNGEDYQ